MFKALNQVQKRIAGLDELGHRGYQAEGCYRIHFCPTLPECFGVKSAQGKHRVVITNHLVEVVFYILHCCLSFPCTTDRFRCIRDLEHVHRRTLLYLKASRQRIVSKRGSTAPLMALRFMPERQAFTTTRLRSWHYCSNHILPHPILSEIKWRKKVAYSRMQGSAAV